MIPSPVKPTEQGIPRYERDAVAGRTAGEREAAMERKLVSERPQGRIRASRRAESERAAGQGLLALPGCFIPGSQFYRFCRLIINP